MARPIKALEILRRRAAVYGPVAAFLAEFFPSRIRYTSVSVPYHIGNGWGGGLAPFITSAAYTSTHSLSSALAYPIIVPAVAFLIALFITPQTHHLTIGGGAGGAGHACRARAGGAGRSVTSRSPYCVRTG